MNSEDQPQATQAWCTLQQQTTASVNSMPKSDATGWHIGQTALQRVAFFCLILFNLLTCFNLKKTTPFSYFLSLGHFPLISIMEDKQLTLFLPPFYTPFSCLHPSKITP